VLEYVDSNLDQEISLTNLAETAGLSAAHLCNAFRHSTGKSPHQFVMHARIERAKELLTRSGLRVIDVAIASGFKNPQHFARVFRSACHLTPTQYKMENMPGTLLVGRDNQDALAPQSNINLRSDLCDSANTLRAYRGWEGWPDADRTSKYR
jgi:AraC-like DNA-binding protein